MHRIQICEAIDGCWMKCWNHTEYNATGITGKTKSQIRFNSYGTWGFNTEAKQSVTNLFLLFSLLFLYSNWDLNPTLFSLNKKPSYVKPQHLPTRDCNSILEQCTNPSRLKKPLTKKWHRARAQSKQKLTPTFLLTSILEFGTNLFQPSLPTLLYTASPQISLQLLCQKALNRDTD